MTTAICKRLNILIPAFGCLLLTLGLLLGYFDRPPQLQLRELFATAFLLTWCSAHFIALAVLGWFFLRSNAPRPRCLALFAANIIAVAMTVWVFIDVLHVRNYDKSSTAAIAILALPVLPALVAAVTFPIAHWIARFLARNQTESPSSDSSLSPSPSSPAPSLPPALPPPPAPSDRPDERNAP